MRVSLSKGDTFLELDPAAGGSVSALKHRDLDILRPGPDRIGPAFDPLHYSAFPMLPFVGRIQDGVFDWGNQKIQLHANMPPEPHAIHGHGWQDCWKVERETKTSATLSYAHSSDAWPWDYEATQQFKLVDDGVNITLSVTNCSANPMPAGLGWHPYFDRTDAVLRVQTAEIWSVDETSCVSKYCAVQQRENLSSGRVVESLNLDTSFRVESKKIEMSWPTHSLTMESDPIFMGATIFVPPGETFFCAEPISHVPNAVNSDLSPEETGLQIIEPGQTISGTIKLRIQH